MAVKKRSIILWVFLALAVCLGLLWQYAPLKDAKERLKAFPLSGPSFAGQDLPLGGWEVDFFKNVNVMKRVYRVGDQTLFITALDGTRNRHVVHDPLYCFRGSGYEVISQTSMPLPSGKGSVGVVRLAKDGKEQDAMYWFSNGRDTYDKPLRYWWQATIRRLTLGLSGEEPILIVVQPLDNSPLDPKEVVHFFPQLLTL